eukprot:scaffold6029_cov277-Pinguiococcus_pyrenoidosus.AAC.3
MDVKKDQQVFCPMQTVSKRSKRAALWSLLSHGPRKYTDVGGPLRSGTNDVRSVAPEHMPVDKAWLP